MEDQLLMGEVMMLNKNPEALTLCVLCLEYNPDQEIAKKIFRPPFVCLLENKDLTNENPMEFDKENLFLKNFGKFVSFLDFPLCVRSQINSRQKQISL